jgi:hypothetical protein
MGSGSTCHAAGWCEGFLDLEMDQQWPSLSNQPTTLSLTDPLLPTANGNSFYGLQPLEDVLLLITSQSGASQVTPYDIFASSIKSLLFIS